MPKTVILIADTALELIPKLLQKNPTIIRYSKSKRKNPSEVILDSTFHYKAMFNLTDSNKRGRPDILHFCLLSILGSPLIKEKLNEVKIFIHTYMDTIIEINPNTRIPKHYVRFVGLMEKLFSDKIISSKGEILMKIQECMTLEKIVEGVDAQQILIFTSKGNHIKLLDVFQEYSKKDIIIVIGGFPHGNYSNKILSLSPNQLSIFDSSLEAWIVISRIIFAREVSLDLI